ncbi:MAG: S8 family serine peptidase [Methanospirillaceae archaeon]|nr:S8 family serine peptidase [Methanospirillaceae archaeon]
MRRREIQQIFSGIVVSIILLLFLCMGCTGDEVLVENQPDLPSEGFGSIFSLFAQNASEIQGPEISPPGIVLSNQSSYPENDQNAPVFSFEENIPAQPSVEPVPGFFSEDVADNLLDPDDIHETGPVSVVSVVPLGIDPAISFAGDESLSLPEKGAFFTSSGQDTAFEPVPVQPETIPEQPLKSLPVSTGFITPATDLPSPDAGYPGSDLTRESLFVSPAPVGESSSVSPVPDSIVSLSSDLPVPSYGEMQMSAASTPESLSSPLITEQSIVQNNNTAPVDLLSFPVDFPGTESPLSIVSINAIDVPVDTPLPTPDVSSLIPVPAKNPDLIIPDAALSSGEEQNIVSSQAVFTDLSCLAQGAPATGTNQLISEQPVTGGIIQQSDTDANAVSYGEGEVVVCFGDTKGPLTEATYSAAHAKIGAEMIGSLAVFGKPEIQLVRLPDGMPVADAVAYYEADPAVLYAEPNYVVTISAVPDDPDYDQLWGMQAVSAPQAWDMTTGSQDVIVAVVDTGVDYTHPDLAANMWVNSGEIPDNGIDDDNNGFVDDYYGWDFNNEDPDPMDENGHGTHCAGTIGAVGNNGIGVAGYNWQVRIMAAPFLGSGGSGYTFDAAQAILYATKMGARVMNHSWGGGSYSKVLHDALAASPAVMSIAASNENYNLDLIPVYPASYDCENIIVTAAIDSNGDLAYFSNYGKNSVDVAAPGVAILSTVLKGGYEYYKGTSMAAPQVSGLAALLSAADPDASALDIIRTIKTSVTPSGQLADKVATGGVINAYESVKAVWNNPLHAEATIEPLSGKAPLNITCIGSATGEITTWVWDFGDYTPPGEGQIVTHTYTYANYFPATLQVSDGTSTDAVTKLVTVYPDAEFTANVTSGDVPLTVAFTSQSTGEEPDAIYWKFGDGTMVDKTKYPVHTYTEAGTYTVTLIVERRGLADQETKIGYITVTDPTKPITAGFTADPQTGPAPLTVCFTEQSTGLITSWNWNFGDGNVSCEQNPIHIYESPGLYTVTLRVCGEGGEDTAAGTILVTDGEVFLLSLESGWNLISTPKTLAPGYDTAAIFAEVDTAGHSIMTYDPSSSDWIILTKDSPIEPLFGYWIYAKTPVTIPLVFLTDPILLPPVRDLLAGWNIIGFAKTTPATAHDTMLSVQDAWIYLIGYDAGGQRYEETIINGGHEEFSDSRLMYPQQGYWTFLNKSGTLAGIGI